LLFSVGDCEFAAMNSKVGRLIVEHEQGGRRRAGYGEALLEDPSARLTGEFGRGFTGTNQRYVRQFYLMFPIRHALRDESSAEGKRSAPVSGPEIRHPAKRMRFEDEDFYVDLVFYNYLLRCFVPIDLEVDSLTNQDIGQMDGYVRMFDARARPA
jgi:YhcG PDDEXK nuclease domain/DUF1016 N-terminal domain